MPNLGIGIDPDYGIGPNIEDVPEIAIQVDRGLTPEDEKRREKLKAIPNPMQPYEDLKKFNRTIQYAKLYRKMPMGYSEPTLVDATLAGHYLRKRDAEGNPIFTSRMLGNPLPMNSAPCPVESSFGTCGRKLRNNVELLFHIQRVHPSESQFYIRKRLDGITEIMYNPFGPDSVVQMASSPVETSPITEALEVDIPEVVELVATPLKSVKHTCEAKGKFGRYDPTCFRCNELGSKK